MLPKALILLLTTAQIPLATEAELPGGQKVWVAADQLLYDPTEESIVARGNTTLKTDTVTLKADEIRYEQKARRAEARGNVMVVSGTFAAIASAVNIDLEAMEAWVEDGLFLKKRNVTEAQLLAARTPHELKKTGDTALTLTGSHFKLQESGEIRVDGLTFTPCDCDPTEPSWRVEAASADVEMGERAILTWPVVYVRDVPVFALPWVYLPLADRRTGFLLPKPTFAGQNGLSLELPFFIALDESYDLTLTSGVFSGSSSALGIRGGRLHGEFRYVPSERTRGEISLGLLYDVRERRNPFEPALTLAGHERGFRGEASIHHDQDMGSGWRNRIDAGFVSDGYYVKDITADVLAQDEYLRSTGVVYRQDATSYLGLEAVFRQAVWAGRQPFGFDAFRQDLNESGQLLNGPRTFARFPALVYSLPERQLLGPFTFGMQSEYVRLAPITGGFGDEGADGIYEHDPANLDPTQGNRVFDPGEREARNRVDLFPRLSGSFHAGRFAEITPYVGFRETLYLGELTGRAAHRGYLLAGTSIGTELVRTFGEGKGAWRHRIEPRAEMRIVPFVTGGIPGAAYDEIDQAIPVKAPGDRFAMWQTAVELRQQLEVDNGTGFRDVLRLDLGQGYDLEHRAVGDTWARMSLRSGPLTLAGLVRYDVPGRSLAQVSAMVDVHDGKGNGAGVSWDSLLVVGSDPLRAGVDMLMGTPLSLVTHNGTRAEQVAGNLRFVLPFGLGVRYDLLLHPNATRVLTQQRMELSYGPRCGCWRAGVSGYVRPDFSIKEPGPLGGPFKFEGLGVNLSIAEFGAFGL